MGVACLGLPAYASVEDVLRRNAGCFDLVYLHRAPVASHYLQLARRHQPRARVVYSVADLHHVRMARQAAVEDRPELLAASRTMRVMECTTAWSADAVITHSAEEGGRCCGTPCPGASVHVVAVGRCRSTPAGKRASAGPRFADRAGRGRSLATAPHAPNADGRKLAGGGSHATGPGKPIRRSGACSPAAPCRSACARWPGRGVTVLGACARLADGVSDRVAADGGARCASGQGSRGKVLTSLAAPHALHHDARRGRGAWLCRRCSATWWAQDAGPDWPSLIVRLHGDEARVRAAAKAGGRS